MSNPSLDFRDLARVNAIAKESAGQITPGQLRWWIFGAEQNGLAPAVIRIGRSVYLSRARFNEWLASRCGEGR